MNFAFDYVKHKTKPQSDGFYFDIETPRGHLFVVLDFAEHDYANLNPSLKGKLETIVSSFVSVSSFSADLFLGFLAKEINNFVHNLAEQSGGPELSCSAALCLVSGDQLSYLLRGDTKISILNGGLMQQLNGDSLAEGDAENAAGTQLGVENIEAPMNAQVQDFTLHDDDVVLVMTRGVAEAIEGQELPAELLNADASDSQALCGALMNASEARGERTLVVISGPYERPVDEAGTEPDQFAEKFGEQLAELRDDLKNKAAAIDVLELDQKIENLMATLAGKADTAVVLGLQRDVLKLGLVSDPTTASKTAAATEPLPPAAATVNSGDQIAMPRSDSAFTLKAALMVLIVSLATGFVGGWLGSRPGRKTPEVWSVMASGNQITIVRKDVTNGGNVTLTVAQPLKSTGEQTFSSFADVQRYVDTITGPATPSAQTSQSSQSPQPTPSADNTTSAAVTEITVKQGDSLKRLAQVYNVSPEKLMELNPGITRWPLIQIGQKIVVPAPGASPSATPSPTPESSAVPTPAEQPAVNGSDTTQVTVGPGDSLNELARRFNTTTNRLKELNPHTNWPRIRSGQRILVPRSVRG